MAKHTGKVCAVAICNEAVVTREWCKKHYMRWFRYGDPNPLPSRQCESCHASFEPRAGSDRYCSLRCGHRGKVIASPEKYAAMRHERYMRNRQEELDAQRRRRLKDPERASAAGRAYYLRTRETWLGYQAEYRVENAGKIRSYRLRTREQRKLYRERNRGRDSLYAAMWRASNLDKIREKEARRRARLASNGVFLVPEKSLRRLLSAAECGHCGLPFTDERPRHIDHREPIARGGTHGSGNLWVLCATCNMSKGARFYSEWRYRDVIGRGGREASRSGDPRPAEAVA